MKSKIKRKTLALVLAISMILMSLPISGIAVAGENNTAPFTNPFSQEVRFDVNGKTESSRSYRIPSMVTLADGTIVAAADIRWNTTFDGGGLDTLVARSTDGGATWTYKVANYLGDNGNVYNGGMSTTFIDPNLLVAADGRTVYMLVDLYAYGVALNGDSSHIQPVADTGFNANGNLKLSNNEHYSYDYYLKDGKIYNSSNQVEDGYTVDSYFNITYIKDGETKQSNLFFADSPFKVARTQYLYLTKSTDGGATWSEPNLLDVRAKAKVAATENALLVSPGNSITTSAGFMVYPTYSFIDSDHQALALIYSVDGVHWERSTDYTELNWSSEGSIVELQNGNLRVFVRNRTGYLCYVDFDMKTMSWIGHTQTTVPTNSNTQLSAITYSKTFNGQQVILVSCPTGPNEAGSNNNDGSCRTNGKIFMGVVAADSTMSWPKSIDVGPYKATAQLQDPNYTEDQGFFAYSCLTERSDGSVAILYENNQFDWGASGSNGDGTYDPENVTTYYTMAGKTFDLEKELEDKNITFDAADVTVSGSGIPSDSRFVAKEITDTQEIEKLLIDADANDVLQFDLDENGNVIRRYFALDAPYRFLDLSFLNENDSEVQPGGMVTVTMDAESLGLSDGDHFMVYHIHPNGDSTYTNGWLNEGEPFITSDGKVTFPMDKFSYVLVFNANYQISGKSVYLVQQYYDVGTFPTSQNNNWALLGVYVDNNDVPHVLIGQTTNNVNEEKVNYIAINGTQYYRSEGAIHIYHTGALSQLELQKETNGSFETYETVDLGNTNLVKPSHVQAVWDVTCSGMEMSEVFKLVLDSNAGGFDIGETEVDLKLEYNITKDVVSVDGNTSLSGNSVVLPTTLTSGGISSNYFGKEVIYRITVRNTGDVDLHGVTVSDILPSGFYKGDVYTSQDGVTWTQASVTDGKLVVATLDLGAQAAQNYYIKVTIADSMETGTYTNTAELNVNNVVTSATAEVLLQNPTQGVLTVSKEVTPALPAITDSIFTFTLTGNGKTETFKLRHGESTSFILPAGTYTVTEAKHISGKFTAQSETLSAAIEAGSTAELKFVNSYVGADYFHINYVPVGSGTVTVTTEAVSIDKGDTITYGNIYGSKAETFTGATFQGWYMDQACTFLLSEDPVFVPAMPVGGWQTAATYTYYAKFEENEATIKYVVVGPEGCGQVSPEQEILQLITGVAQGSTATASSSAYKFVGWYATADCTGTALSTDAHYTPTKSSELWTSATYYAKFEYNLTSLTIDKVFPVGADYSMDTNQRFLFDIVEVDESGNVVSDGVNLTVTIHKDGSIKIDGLTVGHRYKITEKTDWSWRYDKCIPSSNLAGSQANGNSITVKLSADAAANKVTFTNERTYKYWLDGDSYKVNIFKKKEQ